MTPRKERSPSRCWTMVLAPRLHPNHLSLVLAASSPAPRALLPATVAPRCLSSTWLSCKPWQFRSDPPASSLGAFSKPRRHGGAPNQRRRARQPRSRLAAAARTPRPYPRRQRGSPGTRRHARAGGDGATGALAPHSEAASCLYVEPRVLGGAGGCSCLWLHRAHTRDVPAATRLFGAPPAHPTGLLERPHAGRALLPYSQGEHDGGAEGGAVTGLSRFNPTTHPASLSGASPPLPMQGPPGLSRTSPGEPQMSPLGIHQTRNSERLWPAPEA